MSFRPHHRLHALALIAALVPVPALAGSGDATLDQATVDTGPMMLAASGDPGGLTGGPNAENPPAVLTGPQGAEAPPVAEGGVAGYFANWFHRVNEAQASQPHWMTPLVTVTPRLEEEVRYDQYWEHLPNGRYLDDFDAGKGLELIPTTTNEVIFNLPAYEERGGAGSKHVTGWSDYPFLLIKQRLFSENEQAGNAIVTAFLSVSAPTGSATFTQDAWVLTPTLAGGKGFGNFDVQGTTGVAMPFSRFGSTGVQLLTNVALQYHLLTYFWPEFEFNDTIWLTGTARGGKDQLFVTPGIMLGRFVISGRVRFSIGGGYQVALTPDTRTTGEILPTYNHNWILSTRLTF